MGFLYRQGGVQLVEGVGVIQTGRSATCGGGLVLYRQGGVQLVEGVGVIQTGWSESS